MFRLRPTPVPSGITQEQYDKLVVANEQLTKMNDQLRTLLAKGKGDCLYCGLGASDMSKCTSGFPGCARMDDLIMADRSETEVKLDLSMIEMSGLRSQNETLMYEITALKEQMKKWQRIVNGKGRLL